MNEQTYQACIDAYCTAVGANAGVKEHLIANYRVLVGAWKVTHRDLGECAFRFVRDCRIPNWPKEHSEAIGREVDAIRKEKLAGMRPARTEHECPVCEGLGLVVVPIPECFRGGVIRPRLRISKDEHGRMVRNLFLPTCTVVCSAEKCWAGERAAFSNREYATERKRSNMMNMNGYIAKVGAGSEPTVALHEWILSQAQESRKVEEAMATSKADKDELEKTRDIYRSIIGNILARQSAWVEREPYRDPAEVDENEAIPA